MALPYISLERFVRPRSTTPRDTALGLQNQQQQLIRNTDNHLMADLVMKLSHEIWDTVFSNVDIDTKFNSFLNTYLSMFYSSFPLKNAKKNNHKQHLDDNGNKNLM
jgi:hypothetical protein